MKNMENMEYGVEICKLCGSGVIVASRGPVEERRCIGCGLETTRLHTRNRTIVMSVGWEADE